MSQAPFVFQTHRCTGSSPALNEVSTNAKASPWAQGSLVAPFDLDNYLEAKAIEREDVNKAPAPKVIAKMVLDIDDL
jgi:hypothetical protein